MRAGGCFYLVPRFFQKRAGRLAYGTAGSDNEIAGDCVLQNQARC